MSNATCSFYRDEDSSIYLITNWHVLSGRDIFTKKPLNDMLCIPNKIIVNYFAKGSTDTKFSINYIHQVSFDLCDNENPIWLEHKTFSSNIDVAILKVSLPDNMHVNFINELETNKYFDLMIASDVFIIGYPFGLDTLPVWKRGSIASEPTLLINYVDKHKLCNNYRVLVDTATRPGMSGSPVFVSSPVVRGDMGVPDMPFYVSPIYIFLGIYSGRVVDSKSAEIKLNSEEDYFRAQLGVVWKSDVIKDIINEG